MKGYQSGIVGKRGLLRGVCIGAVVAGIAMPAYAQDAMAQSPGITAEPAAQETSGAESDSDILVVGVRQNLRSAQARKRNADTVVDSITADDIGSFPDKSVAEALQRVPGVAVSRFAGSDDTSHFSAEPSGVVIRGLQQVRSEFNGRDTFSANSSRGLSFADVSPELMAGVDVYKNQTAELIEGGIAGSVNLRTRLPFDSKDRLINLYGEMNYGDLAGRGTPALSGIFSDRFDTGIGEVGVMVNGAFSQVKTASQGIQFDRMGIFDGVFGTGTQYIPSGLYLRDNVYDRKRYGVAAALQWKSKDGGVEASLQYNRSQYNNSWRERSIYSSAYSIYGLPTDYKETTAGVVAPATGTPAFTFDDQGNFLTGTWSAPTGYLGETPNSEAGFGVNQDGRPFFNKCYAWEGCAGRRAAQLDTASNALRNDQWTQDIGLNVRWNVSDRLGVRFDAQYVTSEVRNYNASVTTRTFADSFVDFSGRHPRLQINPNRAENINLSQGGVLNPNNYHYYSITDHTEDSDGEEIALRFDADYDLGSDWLDTLRIGGRYADRDQEVRWGAYNWANIANTWTNTQQSYFNVDRPVYPAGNYELAGLPGSSFFGGGRINQDQFVFFNMDKLSSRASLASALGRPSIGVGEYYPVCSNAGYRTGETVTEKFGCYLPGEILKFSERTWAGYGMLKFGGSNARISGVGISGNVGVRAVWTRDTSAGSFTFPIAFTPQQLICQPGPQVNGRPTVSSGCVTSADEIAFGNGATILNDAKADHFHALPSFNLKLDFTDKLLARFAYSRAMSRPDVGLLRNFVTVTRLAPNLQNLANPAIVYGPDGVTQVGYNFEYRGQAGNPALKPITANQFDLTLEYYLTPTNSITLTAFQKNFQNYIQVGSYNLPVTNNGVTRNVLVRGPVNGDGAKIRGFEGAIAYFFDFLPAPLNGFGIQANYTFVDNRGVETINLVSETAAGTAGGGVSTDTTAVQAKALEGISKHSYNLIGVYERGAVSARVAYNWRSAYLVTAIDCCVGLPVWQDAQGFLDSSIRYRIADNFEISLQASNLLGTETVLRQQINNDGLLKPNAWFRNDRRFQLGVRVNY